MKINNCRVDLTDVSAKKEALVKITLFQITVSAQHAAHSRVMFSNKKQYSTGAGRLKLESL